MATIGNIIPLIGKTRLAFQPLGPPLRTFVSSPLLQSGLIFRSPWVSRTLVAWFSSLRPGLSPENEEVKQRLVKCHPRAYSELIRSDIPGAVWCEACMTSCSEAFSAFLHEAFSTPCLKVFFVFCFGASYHEAYSGKASSLIGGASKEEKEHKAENLGFP